MTDIVDRLRGPAPSIMAMRDGAGEIDHLRCLVEAKDAQIKALTEALEKHDAFVRELCAGDFPQSVDGGDLQEALVKHGLYRVEPFDPAKHSDWSGAAEAGDDFYVPTGIARAALAGTEDTKP